MTNNKQSGDLLINIDEASKITNYSLSSLYSKTSKNQIPYTKKTGSKRLWFNKEELLKWRKKPSQNKKNKVIIQISDSQKLTEPQMKFLILAALAHYGTTTTTVNDKYTMTNNKQQTAMKLYTEEQLLNTADAIRDYLKNYPEKFHESMIEKHLKNLTPIELPSDEEIKKMMELDGMEFDEFDPYDVSYLGGAIWMRNKIQGGNND